MSQTPTPPDDALFDRAAEILEAARGHVVRTVNTAMVHANWLIGRAIVEVQQGGHDRAEYGDALLRRLAERLTERFGRGYSYPSVKRMRQFYQTFPQGSAARRSEQKGSALLSLSAATPEPGRKGSALLSLFDGPVQFPTELGWTHYLSLMRVKHQGARAFYEIEAARECWTTRELDRQIASLLYERLAASRDEAGVLALAREGQEVTRPVDVLKDPLVLEFLDLHERTRWLERDLEQAIIDRLEPFLLELGRGFCFVARQRRITLEGDHFYVDLVFYNRLLRCFVLVDLKLGKLTHQDLGQMQMYVNWFDRTQLAEHEEPTVGIVLCSDKNDAMVQITLPEGQKQIVASRYQLYLPSEEELRAALERERAEALRALAAARRDHPEADA